MNNFDYTISVMPIIPPLQKKDGYYGFEATLRIFIDGSNNPIIRNEIHGRNESEAKQEAEKLAEEERAKRGYEI